jgi:hypothetical protein
MELLNYLGISPLTMNSSNVFHYHRSFFSSAVWTVPYDGVYRIWALGAGGGGGRDSSPSAGAATGGGGGGFCLSEYWLKKDSTIDVVIGARVVQTATNVTAANGGSTTVTGLTGTPITTMTAGGGQGGGCPATGVIQAGGSGGVGSGGNLKNTNGGNGGGFTSTGWSLTGASVLLGGGGAGSIFGKGGNGGSTSRNYTFNTGGFTSAGGGLLNDVSISNSPIEVGSSLTASTGENLLGNLAKNADKALDHANNEISATLYEQSNATNNVGIPSGAPIPNLFLHFGGSSVRSAQSDSSIFSGAGAGGTSLWYAATSTKRSQAGIFGVGAGGRVGTTFAGLGGGAGGSYEEENYSGAGYVFIERIR